MLRRPWFASSLSMLVLLGLTAAQEQKTETGRGARVLDSKAVSVLLLLGVGDTEPDTWGGSVAVDKGEVTSVEGWRFRPGDRVTGPGAWQARSRFRPQAKKAQAKKAQAKAGQQAKKGQTAKARAQAKRKAVGADHKEAAAPQPIGLVAANGVVVTVKAPDDAVIAVHTEHGDFKVPMADLAGHAPRTYLEGRVQVQRVPTSATLVDSPDQDDYPAAAADANGAVWVAYVSHAARGSATQAQLTERPKAFESYVPKGGGDQVRLLRFADGRAGEPIDVTPPGRDVWRPAVVVDGAGKVLVTWSELVDGNVDLFARRYDAVAKSWGEPERLTSDPGADLDAALAIAPDGNVWVAWQGWRDGRATVLLARVDQTGAAVAVSPGSANAWSPALAADPSGRLHVAYDTYSAGNYDVHLRARQPDGTLSAPVAVADSPRFEVRPSVAVDARGRIWVGYEERDASWGKDFGSADTEGTALYRGGAVQVRCLDGARRLEAPSPVASLSPADRVFNGFPRLAADRAGRVWLAYRHRLDPRNNGVGGAWVGVVTALSGQGWSPPQIVPGSDGMLDNRPALVVPRTGPVLLAYSGDGRLSRNEDAVANDLNIAALVPVPGASDAPDLPVAAVDAAAVVNPAKAIHPNEAADVARMRAHRIAAGGKTYRLLRGDFHRHTEISGDGGNDGALEDMWRYAIDAASLDWVGNGDHDNGGGKEYTWWVIQKTTDLYHSPGHFTPMFTYERSVQYPHGHRNVMFAHRGVRTLPRLRATDGPGVANGVSLDDTKMLYDQLKALGGICASHTSGTTQMGTDWRDNDPNVEPIVEMFQGIRNSYEYLGAPRVGRTASEAVAGMQPYGMVWHALALQYKLGFQSSSDHISTHISYAVALAEDHSRDAVLDAFRKRHCYAATDNIVLDIRSGDHLMGDEFAADRPVTLHVFAHGTRPIARVDVIKDYVHVYTTEPNRERVEFTWTDNEKRPAGMSWYYVRVVQNDGEMAWASPMWVRLSGAAAVAGE